MRSKIIIEVHDSQVTSNHPEEVEDVHKILYSSMVQKQFSWQRDIPRGADLVTGPNWGELKTVKL
jgi:DNA polymerase I-like protein with 3'-5' exonuclease and polymerase domains